MRSLHIIGIEKFIPHVVEVSEAVNPGQNRYIAVNASGRHASNTPTNPDCDLRPSLFELDDQAQRDLEWCDALFIHWLSVDVCAAILAARPEVVVVWCGFGGDFFKFSPKVRDRQLLPHTLRQRFRSPVERATRSLLATSGVAGLRKAFGVYGVPDAVKAAAPRIDLFCALEGDLQLHACLPGFRARQIDGFGYYTLEGAIGADAFAISGPDLLIGNSATWTNNHFDVFEQLRGLDLEGRRLVLPLSYGDWDAVDAVEEAAMRQFGENGVVVLRDWIPIEEYNATLARCGTVLMNQLRSQAMGTICSMLYRGAKVYLRRENHYAPWLRDARVAFAEFPRGQFDENLFTPLTLEERARNKEIMWKFWRREAVQERTSRIFATVAEEVERRQPGAKRANRSGQ